MANLTLQTNEPTQRWLHMLYVFVQKYNSVTLFSSKDTPILYTYMKSSGLISALSRVFNCNMIFRLLVHYSPASSI